MNMDRYTDYAEGNFVKPGFDFDTQIVTSQLHPQGERIFLNPQGKTIAHVPMTVGTSYGIVCRAILDGFTAAGSTIWDRDDQMDYHRAVTGRIADARVMAGA